MAKKGKKAEEANGPKSVQNRRARYDYLFDAEYEAGMVLEGAEVKSVFAGKANLTDSYCKVVNGEMWLFNVDIEPYSHTTKYQPNRRRDRKLLLHRREIDVIDRKSREKGYSIVPIEMYFKNGRAKVKIGLGRGKSDYDKRESIQKKETAREVQRVRAGKEI